MLGITSAAYRWTIPINLLLIAWVTIARAIIAPDLLWVIGSLLYLAPLLVVLLVRTGSYPPTSPCWCC